MTAESKQDPSATDPLAVARDTRFLAGYVLGLDREQHFTTQAEEERQDGVGNHLAHMLEPDVQAARQVLQQAVITAGDAIKAVEEAYASHVATRSEASARLAPQPSQESAIIQQSLIR